MSGVTIVEFVRARLDDLEQAAKAVEPLGETIDMGGNRLGHSFSHTRNTYASEDGMPRRQCDPAAKAHFDRHDPARVLAQVAAMRAIVELHEEADECGPTMMEAVRHLAAIWSDHEAYDPAWAPEGE